MNDFETEPETAASETDAEVVASGLLPRESYRPGARLAVVDHPEGPCETRRIYREVPVRVDDARSVLLVGPWCEIPSEQTYRVRKCGDRVRNPTGDSETNALLTVELVVECETETRLRRS